MLVSYFPILSIILFGPLDILPVVIAKTSITSKPPHILFIVADDLGYHDVSFHGSEVNTSTLDSLVQEGLHFDFYYGHSICTPSRSSLMTGRFASHTGLQHSYLEYGQDIGLPLKFKTMADHLNSLGYSSHAIGKWHLGFQSDAYTPTGRGFQSFFGYLGGGEDYFTHKSGGYVDFQDNGNASFAYNGKYSAGLFANRTIEIINTYAKSKSISTPLNGSNDMNGPLFLYLAFQSIHGPLQAPKEYISKYNWITNSKRRTLAAMSTCMDDNIGRIINTLRGHSMWENTLLVFVADNGGPPYVANSNYPMRGGKWTMWEGGTHLTAFAVHGGGLLPQGKNYTGLAHHADWLPTLVAAAGAKLNDSIIPPVDGVNLWPSMLSSEIDPPRNHVLINVDQTNQDKNNDPGGWSGYAGLIWKPKEGGYWKLVYGTPGVPNAWCWPDQNQQKSCTMRSGISFPGNDITHSSNVSVDVCCLQCQTANGCVGWTWHKDTGCWLKSAIPLSKMESCSPAECISGSKNSNSPVPMQPIDVITPMPDPSSIKCGYSGKVPANKTGFILFDLIRDPQETTNLASEENMQNILTTMRHTLDGYIETAVEPLNETPQQRHVDPMAKKLANKTGAWGPWEAVAKDDHISI